MKNHIVVLAILTVASVSGICLSDNDMRFLGYANAAWVYDISNNSANVRRYDPGYFSEALNRYNQASVGHHKIEVVYTYAGSLEMYCPEKRPERCDIDHLVVGYPPGAADKRLHRKRNIETVEAYRQKINSAALSGELRVVPVIDGVVNAAYSGSMKGFNELDQALAERFADKVARRVCSDPDVPGVQFDIEPFDVRSKNGQYFFYRRIAENFSGGVPSTKDGPAVQCKNRHFPRGRFFSVFTSSRHLNPDHSGGRNIADISNHRGNGYVIAALYDLGSGPPGQRLSVDEYRLRARRHASQMAKWAEALQVPYRFGIPAAATAHEHEACRGHGCSTGEHPDNESQEGYVISALEAIQDSGARSSKYFLGVAVWAWTRGIRYKDMELEPGTPPPAVLRRLQKQL